MKQGNLFKNVYRESMMVLIFLIVFAMCSILVPYFFSARNLIGLLLSVSQIGMVAPTMMLCLASRDFDLSVGSQIAFFSVVSVLIVNATASIILSLVGVVIVGIIVGAVNGVFVSKLKINALIATLATMQIVRGLAFIFSGGQSLSAEYDAFFVIGTATIAGIPLPVFITACAFVVFGLVLNYTVFGRNVLAVGGNAGATYLAGVNVDRVRTVNFALQGLMCAFAGFILASRLTSAQPTVAQGFELSVISACVLGGVSLYGGKATILGVIAGVLIMGTVQNVMNLINIPVFYQYVVSGAILLLAVSVDKVKERMHG